MSFDFRSSAGFVKFQSPKERGTTNFCRPDTQNQDNGSSSLRKKRNETNCNRSVKALQKEESRVQRQHGLFQSPETQSFLMELQVQEK